jgi:hypothetical protein
MKRRAKGKNAGTHTKHSERVQWQLWQFVRNMGPEMKISSSCRYWPEAPKKFMGARENFEARKLS